MLNKDTKVQSKHGLVLTRRIARVAVRRVIHINVRTYLLKSPSIWNGAAHYKVYGGWPNMDNSAARSAREGLVPRDDDEKRERTFLERLAEEAVHARAHAELLRGFLAVCTERDDR